MNFGSRGVTAAALLPGCMRPLTGVTRRLPARLGGDSELGAVARWSSRNWVPWLGGAVGIGCRDSVGQSELGAAALLKAVCWDLRLASLLTHLFY